ncbi:MAG: YceI family protein [Pseudomonadota bacterium]
MRIFLAILILLFPAFVFAEGEPVKWELVPEKSKIEWETNYGAQKIKGSFHNFTTNILFDIENPENSKIKVKIDLSSIKSDESNAKSMLPGKDWLNTSKYPFAFFEIETIKAVTGEEESNKYYNAVGNLTIKDKTIRVNLPFNIKFSEDKKTANASGELTLNRLDFGIGKGEWEDTSVVTNEVKVSFYIDAISE